MKELRGVLKQDMLRESNTRVSNLSPTDRHMRYALQSLPRPDMH